MIWKYTYDIMMTPFIFAKITACDIVSRLAGGRNPFPTKEVDFELVSRRTFFVGITCACGLARGACAYSNWVVWKHPD